MLPVVNKIMFCILDLEQCIVYNMFLHNNFKHSVCGWTIVKDSSNASATFIITKPAEGKVYILYKVPSFYTHHAIQNYYAIIVIKSVLDALKKHSGIVL